MFEAHTTHIRKPSVYAPSSKLLSRQRASDSSSGFTLIELMIVIAVIAILLAIALPTYQNYAIRARIAEALSVGMAAKTATSSVCHENPIISSLNNSLAGYAFSPGGGPDDFVTNVQISGPCSAPIVTITTVNIGTTPDPIIVLTADFTPGSGQVRWTCHSNNTPNHLLPGTCRS